VLVVQPARVSLLDTRGVAKHGVAQVGGGRGAVDRTGETALDQARDVARVIDMRGSAASRQTRRLCVGRCGCARPTPCACPGTCRSRRASSGRAPAGGHGAGDGLRRPEEGKPESIALGHEVSLLDRNPKGDLYRVQALNEQPAIAAVHCAAPGSPLALSPAPSLTRRDVKCVPAVASPRSRRDPPHRSLGAPASREREGLQFACIHLRRSASGQSTRYRVVRAHQHGAQELELVVRHAVTRCELLTRALMSS